VDVFISWSGKTSHAVALILRDWLPTVLHSITPWVSSEDIEKGKRWSIELARKLETCPIGIICVDQSNIKSPWLNFEAGALSKLVQESRLFPVMLDIQPSDLKGPLSQFQVTLFQKNDFQKLVQSINASLEIPIAPERIGKTFECCWPGLLIDIDGLKTNKPSTQDFITVLNTPQKLSLRQLIEQLKASGLSVEKYMNIDCGVYNSELATWLIIDGKQVSVFRFPSVEHASEISEQESENQSFHFNHWVFMHMESDLGLKVKSVLAKPVSNKPTAPEPISPPC
jgi:TIR domain